MSQNGPFYVPSWKGLLICTWIKCNNMMSSNDLALVAWQESIYSGGWKHPILTSQVCGGTTSSEVCLGPPSAGGELSTGKPQQLCYWNC